MGHHNDGRCFNVLAVVCVSPWGLTNASLNPASWSLSFTQARARSGNGVAGWLFFSCGKVVFCVRSSDTAVTQKAIETQHLPGEIFMFRFALLRRIWAEAVLIRALNAK